MKRIVFFINSLGSGGAEHQLVQLADGLSEHGYDVTITTFSDIPDHYQYSSKVNRVKIKPNKNIFIKIIGIFCYFINIRTDWIIGFGQRANRLFLIPLLFRSKRSVHAIASERGIVGGKKTQIDIFTTRYLYRRADYIVPNSYSQRDHIIELSPDSSQKTVTITNYTDINLFQKIPLPNGNFIRVGVFGRYTIQKNCIRFVEAINVLKKRTNISFVIEWHGDQSLKNNVNPMYVQMNNKVKEYHLENVLLLKDHVKDVASLMPVFDAICLPSLWEGFSNSISEAICCGKPMLVSNVDDNVVMVKDGENGFLFDPLDIESIVDAFLKFFLLEPEKRQSLGNKSREIAEGLFNKEVFFNKYIELIESK